MKYRTLFRIILALNCCALISCATSHSTEKSDSIRYQMREASEHDLDLIRNSQKLIVYYNPRCPHCSRARAWLDSRKVSYDARNVQDPKYLAEFRALGGRGVPLFFRKGKELRGFEEVSLAALLR